jgi:C4-dicarboxylate transporter DctQ subunit
LLLAAVALNFANVIARYAFGRPIVTAEEILQFANVWIVMLAGAAVTHLGTQLRMDILVQTHRPRLHRGIEIAIAALGIFLSAFVVYNAAGIISYAMGTGQRSVAANLPLYLIYFAVPVGFGCTLLFLAERMWRLIRGGPINP